MTSHMAIVLQKSEKTTEKPLKKPSDKNAENVYLNSVVAIAVQ